ncbi:hypothetical protein BH09VER1_BH09VER1_54900 [soil metagenome]
MTESTSQNWIEGWPDVQRRLLSRPRILLALDFDGIIAPVASRPEESRLPEDFRNLLSKLEASPRIVLALISGRSLVDLRTRVGLGNVIYAGNHGMEMEGAGFMSSDGLASSCRCDLVDALTFLSRCARRLRGVVIEDKGLSITIHWRLALEKEREALAELLEVITNNHPRLEIFPGDATWNIRGRASWDKCDAIGQMLDYLELASTDVLYLADGFTDERTFARLSAGLTFCVNSTALASARYLVPTRMEVMQLLFSLLCAVNKASLS